MTLKPPCPSDSIVLLPSAAPVLPDSPSDLGRFGVVRVMAQMPFTSVGGLREKEQKTRSDAAFSTVTCHDFA